MPDKNENIVNEKKQNTPRTNYVSTTTNKTINLGVDFENVKVDIVGSDVIITNLDGTQKVFAGLGIKLFSDNPPKIFSNNQLLSPDDFLNKIGPVKPLEVEKIQDVLTSLVEKNGQANSDAKVNNTEKVVIQEVVKYEQVFTDTSSNSDPDIGNSFADSTISSIEKISKDTNAQKEEYQSKQDHEAILENLVPPTITFSAPPRPVPTPFNGIGDGYSSLSSNVKLLQTPYSLDFDNETSILSIRGGGGTLSAAIDESRATQVESEVIDLSEYVGETETFTDDPDLFTDNLITRVVSFEALMPLQYYLTNLTISGLPSGFSFAGYTPNSDGDYRITGSSLFTGRLNLLLQYDPTQFSNAPTDIDGDGISAEYADFDLTFSYKADLLTDDITATADFTLEDEVLVPVIVKQANLDDFVYNGEPEGWVIDIDVNDNIVLTGNSDATVYGGPSRDNITSSFGSDYVEGRGGDDVIRTGIGNDFISGGKGNNSIDAGANIDTLTYAERTEDITLSLSENPNQDGFYSATVGDDFVDLIRAVENIILGSGNDDLRGSLVDNVLEGRGGNDILDGALGNDTLLGGDGNDILKSGFGNNIIDGGTGTNTVQYAQSETGINVNQSLVDDNDYYSVVNGDYTDQVKNISRFEGTNFNDTIVGDTSNQQYYGLEGDDIIDGGEGLDIIDGGDGNDLATYASLADSVSVSSNRVTDSNGNIENLVNIERIAGTNFNDNFVGTVDDNIYLGLDGDDEFIGTLGNDLITGGSGTDHLDYSSLSSALTLNAPQEFVTTTDDASLRTDFSGIERVTGSSNIDLIDYSTADNNVTANLTTNIVQESGKQSFNVLDFENIITGQGNDTITGNIGNNIINSRQGDDNIYATDGIDTINGGLGTDTFHINTTQDGSINLDAQTITGFTGEFIENDTIIDIENITQTGDGNTTLTGNASDNTFITGGGDDNITFSSGNDTIDSGSGIDTFDYSNINSDTNFNLSVLDDNGYANFTSGSNVTRIRNIENITATAQDDVITGNDSNNIINAGDGDDLIDGGAGLDTIDGGEGTDTATYESLNAAVTVSGDTIFDINGNIETVTNIENITGTNYNDTFNSDAGNNNYLGADGDDIFDASVGTDNFQGGDGTDILHFNAIDTNVSLTIDLGQADFKTAIGGAVNTSFNRIESIIGSFQSDTVTYASTSEDVTVNLQTNFATGLGGDADYNISGIENVTGGSGNDRIAGDSFTNFLDAGAGNSDVLLSTTNQDGTLNLALLGNQISGYTGGDEELTGDTVVNFEGFEHTGTGNQIVTGSTLDNIIRTGSGDDIINGGAGADTLDGNFANAQRREDVVFDTFEGQTEATGWLLQNGVVVGVSTVDSSNSTFTDFMGPAGRVNNNNQILAKNYTVTGTKEHAVIEFDFYEIDSWDHEYADFYINNQTVLRYSFQTNTNEYAQNGSVTIDDMTINYTMSPQTEFEDIGLGSHNDQIHKIQFVIENPTENILFSTSAFLNSDIENESFGLDNVYFYTTNNLLGTDDGIDTLSYAADSVGVTIDLENETASGVGSHAEGDSIRNFDNVIGGSGDDIITTRNYAVNVINAGSGDDRVIASIGTGDTLDGGTHNTQGDTLVVRHTRNTITDLSLNSVTFSDYGDDLFGDTFSNFENYESTAFTHEKIIGTSDNNRLTTSIRDDYFIGGAGDDIIDGGGNYIVGGDWAAYTDNADVTVNLTDGTAISSTEGNDTLINIENIRTAGGNDSITGDAFRNTIDGGGGNDTINTLAEIDVVSGKSGNDNIDGGSGNDHINGGSGSDTLNGGSNNDYILGDNSHLDGLTHFYALNEGSGSTLTNQGSAGGALTQGRSLDPDRTDSLASGDGLGWEYGSPDGNNFLHFSRHNDNLRPVLPTITAEKGFTVSSWVKFDDRISHSGIHHDFVFRLVQDNSNYIDVYRNWSNSQLRVRMLHDGEHRNLVISSITDNEWAHFSVSMDETGFLRAYFNGIQRVSYQYDAPFTEATYANNYLGIGWHGSEQHQIDGGIANFSVHERTLSHAEVSGLYVDTKTGIDITDNAVGDDIINGTSGNNILSGGGGADTINAGTGNDTIEEVGDRAIDNNNTLNGGNGNDIIYSNLASNDIDGGTGTNTLRYDHFSNIVTENLVVNLSSGSNFQGTVTDGTDSDNFQNIQTIYGGSGDDGFIGDAGNNIFYGNDGGDSFYGAQGNDQFHGGDSRDTIDFSAAAGSVTARLETSISGLDINGIVDIDGDSGTDTFTNIENFIGSNFGDIITGSSDDNAIQTGNGNDLIYGSVGTDIINGGSDTDTIDYTAFDQTTIISTTNISGSLTGTDTYFSIENIDLGAGDDSFTAVATDLFANVINIDFGDGQDTVSALSGAVSSNIVNIADELSNVETLDFSLATGSTTITGDDVAALTDSNNTLRLDISSSFAENVVSGGNYNLINTTDNGSYMSYDFAFGAQSAQLNIYEV